MTDCNWTDTIQGRAAKEPSVLIADGLKTYSGAESNELDCKSSPLDANRCVLQKQICALHLVLSPHQSQDLRVESNEAVLLAELTVKLTRK
ncbi:MAG: hypothetical protein FRX49_11125 [Trebouxia sp. A1-2]|nr:MAG: hypothetical protein FRX49_11125 [Trebouxia sp. A1-2]